MAASRSISIAGIAAAALGRTSALLPPLKRSSATQHLWSASSRHLAQPTPRFISSTSPRHNTSSSHSPSTRTCPACSSPVPLAASPCPSCRALLPIPSDLTHHALFGLCEPATGGGGVAELEGLEGGGFDVDARELRGRFLRRQQGVHPDSFASQGERMRSLAETQSSLLNKAYSTLLDPLSRAQYLLELHGQPIEETDSLTDPALLMEIMDAREQLEEAEREEDVERVKGDNEERTKTLLADLSEAFGARDIPRAKQLTVELQYLRNLANAAKEWRKGERVEIRH